VDTANASWAEKGNPVVPMPVGAKSSSRPWARGRTTPPRRATCACSSHSTYWRACLLAWQPTPIFSCWAGRKPEELRAELEKLHQRRVHERKVEYRRSDGTLFPLTVADVYARRSALEMAYNPNDCAEVRWGADANNGRLRHLQTPRPRRAAQPHAGVSDVVPRGAPPIALIWNPEMVPIPSRDGAPPARPAGSPRGLAVRAVWSGAPLCVHVRTLGARTTLRPMKCFPSERPIYLMIGWHSSEDS